MPHQCTTCGRTFADGSKEMLSGCPDCGGNKFQFRPEGGVADGDTDQPPQPPEDGGLADAAARAGAAVRDRLAGDGSASDPARPAPTESESSAAPSESTADPSESGVRPADLPDSAGEAADGAVPEDSAQADARTDVVSPEELPSAPPDASDPSPDGPPDDPSRHPEEPPDAEGEVVQGPAAERPDLEELRAELNDQFESIRVVNPGEYELNLMELYDRQEYIISLQEDGRYVIEVPDTWADEE